MRFYFILISDLILRKKSCLSSESLSAPEPNEPSYMVKCPLSSLCSVLGWRGSFETQIKAPPSTCLSRHPRRSWSNRGRQAMDTNSQTETGNTYIGFYKQVELGSEKKYERLQARGKLFWVEFQEGHRETRIANGHRRKTAIQSFCCGEFQERNSTATGFLLQVCELDPVGRTPLELSEWGVAFLGKLTVNAHLQSFIIQSRAYNRKIMKPKFHLLL